ncbi:MAG: 4Fe-4S binding protein [Chloroflexi bacterium]|nr:4Fe-4S binding protein [Chloroflexota bacterium]
MTLRQEFVAVFGVWEEARPYLHMMVDEQDMQLVVAMKGAAITVEQATQRLAIDFEQAADLLQRCTSRCIVNKTEVVGVTTYTPADFGACLDHFAKYGRWDDLPPQARQAIDRRFLDEFIASHRPSVARKMQGLATQGDLPNDTVLLLDEVEEMIEAASHIVVQPCDCRRLGQNCDRPVNTCIWLDEGALEALDRGYGNPLSKEEAKELVRWADRKGLMHTADSEWQTRGLHAICNCCACDCYPFRAAMELGSKGVWPQSRYIAVHDPERCTLCGACVQRCHFAAFYHGDPVAGRDGEARRSILFDPDRCWGCGLCANTCPTVAIEMLACAQDVRV